MGFACFFVENSLKYHHLTLSSQLFSQMNGADPAAHLTCKPFEDTEDKRAGLFTVAEFLLACLGVRLTAFVQSLACATALLRAALSLCHGDGFSKTSADSHGCERNEG